MRDFIGLFKRLFLRSRRRSTIALATAFSLLQLSCAVRNGFRGENAKNSAPEPIQPIATATPAPEIRPDVFVPVQVENSESDSFTLPELQVVDRKTCSQLLNYITIPAQPFTGDDGGSAKYRDVMIHYDTFHDKYGGGRHFARGISGAEFYVVSAHETVHFTTYGQYQRTVSGKPTEGHQFIYLGDGKGVRLARSFVEKKDMVSLVDGAVKTLLSARKTDQSPVGFPDSVYKTYVEEKINASSLSSRAVGQLFEEWSAYLADFEVVLELIASKKYADTPSGKNFSILYLALVAAQAISLKDPEYFAKNDPKAYYQLKPLVACMVEKAVALHARALSLNPPSLKVDERVLSELRSGPGSASLRAFIKKWQGDSWTKSTLGF